VHYFVTPRLKPNTTALETIKILINQFKIDLQMKYKILKKIYLPKEVVCLSANSQSQSRSH